MKTTIRALFVAALAAMAQPAQAQFTPGAGTEFDQALRSFAIENSIDRPSVTASASQDSAPSGSGIAPTVLNKAGATSLLSVALDNSLVTVDDKQAITLNFNLFALLAAQDPSILADNQLYAGHSALRRVSASITLGGAADEVTAATDGESDNQPGASEGDPSSLLDAVTVRASWRLLGSRDRRDHYGDYTSQLDDHREALSRSQTEFLLKRPGLAAALATATGGKPQYEVLLGYMRENPTETKAVIDAYAGVESALDTLNAEIDRSFLVTLACLGELRAEDTGKDKVDLELIGEGAVGTLDFTGNLSYRWEEKDADARDQEVKLAIGVAKKIMAGALAPNGFDTSLNLAGQLRNNDRDNVLSVNAGLDFPLGNGLKIPLSVTWASRSDLIDESYVRGNFGLSYDLSAFKRNQRQ